MLQLLCSDCKCAAYVNNFRTKYAWWIGIFNDILYSIDIESFWSIASTIMQNNCSQWHIIYLKLQFALGATEHTLFEYANELIPFCRGAQFVFIKAPKFNYSFGNKSIFSWVSLFWNLWWAMIQKNTRMHHIHLNVGPK